MSKFFSFFFVLFFAFVFVSCGDINVDLGGGGDDSTPTPPPVGEEEGEEEVEEGYVLGDFEIGDVGPAGGLIFYIDEAEEFEWTFLEAAPEDLESVVWAAASCAAWQGRRLNNLTMAKEKKWNSRLVV